MKIRFFHRLFAVVLILLLTNSVAAQEKTALSVGVGLPEAVFIGLRVPIEQVEVGLSVGSALGASNSNYSLSGEFYYHFGGRSELSTLRPWYLKSGLTYTHNEDEWERHTSLFLVPRVGREFNISSNFGIALEAGLMYIINDEETIKKERPDSFFGNWDWDWSGLLLPSGAVSLYYRF